MLALYHAELARVLHLQCEDIGELNSEKSFLIENSTAWEQALLHIKLYNLLYDFLEGDGLLMRNWLRRKNEPLKGILLIMDDYKINEAIEHIQRELRLRWILKQG